MKHEKPLRGKAHDVGHRADWLTFSGRVDLSPEALELLRTRGKTALREDAPAPVLLGRYEGNIAPEWGAAGCRPFRVYAPSRDGKWLLQNDAMRVTVLEAGAGAICEAFFEGAKDVAWTVTIEMSGTALLASTPRGAVLEAWHVMSLLGEVYEVRIGRIDLCVDVAGYDLREADRGSFVKSRRVHYCSRAADGRVKLHRSKSRRTDGKTVDVEGTTWKQDGRRIVDEDDEGVVASYVGDTFTGFAFGLSRKSVSCRIYDKVLQLQTPKKGAKGIDSDKRRAEFREWTKNGWKGLDEEPHVTRVEFEVHGEALDELGLRVSTKPETGGADGMVRALLAALDPAWAYFTEKWLRLVRRGSCDKATGMPEIQPRWRVVQGVAFEAWAPPKKRARDRSGAKAPQALGCMLSLLASRGEMPPPPWLPKCNGDGEVLDPWRFNDEPGELVAELVHVAPILDEDGKVTNDPEGESEAKAQALLVACVGKVARRAGATIAKCSTERYGGARGALSNVFTKWGASLARFPDATEGGPVDAVAV